MRIGEHCDRPFSKEKFHFNGNTPNFSAVSVGRRCRNRLGNVGRSNSADTCRFSWRFHAALWLERLGRDRSVEGKKPKLHMGCGPPSLTDTNDQLSRFCVSVLCGTDSWSLLQPRCCEQDEYGISGRISAELSSFVRNGQFIFWAKSSRNSRRNLPDTEKERAVGFNSSDLDLLRYILAVRYSET
jgi:hypothetical protein